MGLLQEEKVSTPPSSSHSQARRCCIPYSTGSACKTNAKIKIAGVRGRGQGCTQSLWEAGSEWKRDQVYVCVWGAPHILGHSSHHQGPEKSTSGLLQCSTGLADVQVGREDGVTSHTAGDRAAVPETQLPTEGQAGEGAQPQPGLCILRPP